MINFGEAQYVSYLTIGRQVIAGVLDSGSFELVVFGADCRTCGAAAHYSAHLSRSYRQGILMTQQNYGSGELVSLSGVEEVVVGSFPAVQQAFWGVQKAQMEVLSSAAFEAVVGLGPPETPMVDAWDAAAEAVANVTAYYDLGMEAPDNVTAIAQARVTVANEMAHRAPLLYTLNCTSFSVCIGARPDSDGVFVWNDTVAFAQPELFARVPVVGTHTWTVNLTEPFLDYPAGLGLPDGQERPSMLGCEGGCSALLDSGTSLLAVPRMVMQAVQLAMTRLRPDCGNLEVLPDLVFVLGGSTFRLPPDAYMAKVVGDLPEFLRQEKAPGAGRGGQQLELACQMMLMETPTSPLAGQLWILGIPFFRSYYTTFSLGRSRGDRALYMAPHGEDDACTPHLEAEAFIKKGPLQLRYVAAERVRFPQATALGDRVRL